MSTTAHGYHCAPTPTPTTFKETARSETSLAEPPTSGGGVVGSVANPPFGGSTLSGAPPPWGAPPSVVDREVHHSKHKTTPFLFEAGRPGGVYLRTHCAYANFDRVLVLCWCFCARARKRECAWIASRNHAFSREEKAWCTAYTPLVPEECFVA